MKTDRLIIKSLAIVMCTVLLAGSIGASVYSLNTSNTAEPAAQENVPVSDAAQEQTAKDETVYVLAGSDGSVQKIIVSDWIKNAVGGASVSDVSELNNIENVKGDETYSMNGDNMRVWDAQGNDIYYQGDIEKELPVGLTVSYTLDGKSVAASDLAGSSGKVTIRFDYENNQYETVKIDGKEEKIYVPFVMLTGLLLDNSVFTNVEVSNGKLINDGNHSAVVGIAFPGLQSNLGISREKYEIPDYVEITADVMEFKMTNTVTVATNEVFSKLDTDKLDSADDLTQSIDSLTGAVTELMNGSSGLYDGLCTLLDKSDELVSGIDQLAQGAAKLKEGAGTLDSGAGQLVSGADRLSTGLQTLVTNNDSLNTGSKQVFDSLLATTGSQLAAAGLSVPELTQENYAQVLNSVIASLDKDSVGAKAQEAAREKVTEAVMAGKDTVEGAVTQKVRESVYAGVSAAVRENVTVQVLATMGMTKEQYTAGITAGLVSRQQQDQVNAAVDAQMQTAQILSTISANTDTQMLTDDIKTMIAQKTDEQINLLIEQNMNSPEVQNQITQALAQASSGAASVSSAKAQLDSYNTFYQGLLQYTSGVSAASDGAAQLSGAAAQLKNGTSEVYSGMSGLYDGILTLKNGAPALTDGVGKLRDGAMQLSQGLKEFNEKGISKLAQTVNGDIMPLITRIRATADVSKNYKNFSGISDSMDGQVKFIYRTDSVEAK